MPCPAARSRADNAEMLHEMNTTMAYVDPVNCIVGEHVRVFSRRSFYARLRAGSGLPPQRLCVVVPRVRPAGASSPPPPRHGSRAHVRSPVPCDGHAAQLAMGCKLCGLQPAVRVTPSMPRSATKSADMLADSASVSRTCSSDASRSPPRLRVAVRRAPLRRRHAEGSETLWCVPCGSSCRQHRCLQ